MRPAVLTLAALALISFCPPPVRADESPLPVGAAVKLEAQVAFTEGPAWHKDGNVYFTDIVNNRIMRRDKTGALHVYRTPSGRANGLAFDTLGRLIACEGGAEGGNRRVTRTGADGVVETLVDRYRGKKLNSPNDLVIDSQGRIYFSDPRYGDRTDVEQFDKQGRIVEGVYRIDTDGSVTRIIEHEVDRPNGLAISPDGKYLFVADNVNSGVGFDKVDHRCLWRFNLTRKAEIVAGSRRKLFDWGTDRGPDGMAIDRAGRLYVAAGFNHPNSPRETSRIYKAGIYVISAEGELIDFIPVAADMITNCTFGGEDAKTLYITAGHKLWSIDLQAAGHRVWPES